MKPKLAYITRKYPPSIGGMQRFNQKLVEHLRRIGDFRLLAWGRSQALLPFFLAGAFFQAARWRITAGIDTIYLSDALLSPLGAVLKLLFNLRVLVSVHGRDSAFAFPGYLRTVSRALKKVDGVICVSRHLRERCRRMGVADEIIHVIPNGVSVEDFAWSEKTAPEQALGLDLTGRTVLLSVGRLVPKKGMDRFVGEILPRVVRRRPEIVCLVAGDGPLRARIEALAEAAGLGNHLIMLGDIPMNDLRLKAAYNCAGIFVMPNVPVRDDVEGFGIVALEAGAAGCAVVASRLEGIEEAVSNGDNGILLDWNDTDAFVEVLAGLAGDPERTRELGARARRFVGENYDWKLIAARYARLFELEGNP